MHINLSASQHRAASRLGGLESTRSTKSCPILTDGFLILVGLSQAIEISVGGRLLLSEIFLILALPVLVVSHGRHLARQEVKQFLFFASLWLTGAILTDAIRETTFDDLARGWSRIAFFASNFLALYLLVLDDRRRLLVLLSGIFIGATLKLQFFPNTEVNTGFVSTDILGTAWRFGYGQCFTFFAFLISVFLIEQYSRYGSKSVQLIAAIINLALQARNLFGIAALAAISSMLKSNREGRPLSNSKIFAAFIVIAATGFVLVNVYSYMASTGALGFDAQNKYLKQSSGTFGLLLGGRTESIASTQAIIDSPLIGHGSWARSTYYVMLRAQAMEQAGYEIVGNPFQNDLIPSHSMLLGSWVEAGILGALFWFWALAVTVRGFITTIKFGPKTAPIVALVLISAFWDILFSPFGLDRRLVIPAYLVTALMAVRRRV